jgi:chromosome segregation ATPase
LDLSIVTMILFGVAGAGFSGFQAWSVRKQAARADALAVRLVDLDEAFTKYRQEAGAMAERQSKVVAAIVSEASALQAQIGSVEAAGKRANDALSTSLHALAKSSVSQTSLDATLEGYATKKSFTDATATFLDSSADHRARIEAVIASVAQLERDTRADAASEKQRLDQTQRAIAQLAGGVSENFAATKRAIEANAAVTDGALSNLRSAVEQAQAAAASAEREAAKYASLPGRIEHLEAAATDNTSAHENFEKAFLATGSLINDLNAAIGGIRTQIGTLAGKPEVAVGLAKIDAILREQMTLAKGEVGELRSSIVDLYSRAENSSAMLFDIGTTIKDGVDKVAALAATQTTSSDAITALAQRITEAEARVATVGALEVEIATASSNIATLTRLATDSAVKIDDAVSDLAEVAATVGTLRENATTLADQVSSLNGNVVNLDLYVRRAVSDLAAADSEISERIGSMDEALTAAEEDLNTFEEQIEKIAPLGLRVTELGSALAETTQSQVSLTASVDTALAKSVTRDTMSGAIEAAIGNLRADVANLVDGVASAVADNYGALAQRVSRLETEERPVDMQAFESTLSELGVRLGTVEGVQSGLVQSVQQLVSSSSGSFSSVIEQVNSMGSQLGNALDDLNARLGTSENALAAIQAKDANNDGTGDDFELKVGVLAESIQQHTDDMVRMLTDVGALVAQPRPIVWSA